MEGNKLIIPIDKIKSDFQSFLTPEHNRRVIFSGPFGIGKTYFLNEFFKEKAEYFPIFLRPINYSLLSNEDVFKFIKYDILAQLVKKEKINIDEDIKVSTSAGLKSFLKNNKLLVLKNLLKVIPKLGGFSDSIEEVEELYLKYRESKEKLSKELSGEQVKIFNEDFEEHFLSEFDNVSSIIKQVILEEKLKTVLIIDDLDRLDPEHIFRLFNVFSAHFDIVNDDSNKFGFDKIVFVCDIENIRKIFAHKYGTEVDFSGYIDKFYSSRPFFLNNTKYIYDYINKSFNIQEIPGEVIELIKIIIANLFWNGRINLRTLEKLFKEEIPTEIYRDEDFLSVNKNYEVKAKYLNWIRYLSILKPIFGKYSKLISEIKQLSGEKSIEIYGDRFLKIKDILANSTAILNEQKINSLLPKGNYREGQDFPNHLLEMPIGPIFNINVNLSFLKKGLRISIYEVSNYDTGPMPSLINVYDLSDSIIRIIIAGRYLHLLEED